MWFTFGTLSAVPVSEPKQPRELALTVNLTLVKLRVRVVSVPSCLRFAEHGPGDRADGGDDGVGGRRAADIERMLHDGIARSGSVGAEHGRNCERESEEEHQPGDAGDQPEPDGDHPKDRSNDAICFH